MWGTYLYLKPRLFNLTGLLVNSSSWVNELKSSSKQAAPPPVSSFIQKNTVHNI